MSSCACNTRPLSPVQHNPHAHMNGCSGGGGRGGGTTVGGSGCDLDTVWHTAFLMGHFDHCHSLYPPLLLLLPAILKHKDSANTATQTLLRSFLMMAAVNLAVETPQSERRCEFWRCCTQKKNKKTTDVNKLFFLL